MIKIKENDFSDWNKFIQRNLNSTFFHTIEWKNVIEKTYGYKPKYFTLYDDNEIKAVFPLFHVKSFLTNKLLSLPFSFAAGPLYVSEKYLDKLIEYIIHSYNNFLEIRTIRYLPQKIIVKYSLHEKFNNYVSLLDITHGFEFVWNNMSKKHRNAIRKSKKHGVIVSEVSSKDELKTYFNIKNKLSARKHGIPAEPLKYYYNLWDILSPSNKVKIFYAYYKGKVIGGIILFLHKDEVLYVSGASDEKYLYYQPYNALIWKAIKWSCENNYKKFNFGISSVNNTGLLEFKKRWGTNNFKIPTYYYGDVSNKESLEWFKAIWSKLPISLTKIFGKYLVR
ncbi:MAG: peptidoglycan bridge formation glycyltransferase FemA/FemB family protein [Candidatus Aenigmarchaeota archaeon]|nr:peptidoglycan bridge formation glycyltransferase FemA/FemB family protein [Candidatus Aenigmarchaeota archaeon]